MRQGARRMWAWSRSVAEYAAAATWTRHAARTSEPKYGEAKYLERSKQRIESVFDLEYGSDMLETAPLGFAEKQIGEVRRQLLDAAAFGKSISPEQLENMAGKLLAALGAFRLSAAGEDSGKP
ncbi:DUF6374 family protein [Nocardia sp. NPDC004260]